MDDFEEEIIVEDDPEEEIFEEKPEESEEKVKDNKQIVITKDAVPFILSIIAICLSFFKSLFVIVLATSYTAMVVLYSIFFAGAVACALASLILILLKNKKVSFSAEFVFSLIAIVISFI